MDTLRKVLTVVVAIAIALVFTTPAAAQSLGGNLTGAQPVPPSGSPATGFACFTLRQGTFFIDYEITYTGLTGAETAAHVHASAGPGVNGPILYTLPLGTPKIGAVGPITIPQFAAFSAGQWYVDIHTSSFPDGEIRGQIPRDSPCVVPVEPTTWGSIKALYR